MLMRCSRASAFAILAGETRRRASQQCLAGPSRLRIEDLLSGHACRRSYSTEPSSSPADSVPPSPDSHSEPLFSATGSAWDLVFKDVKDTPPLIPPSARGPPRAQIDNASHGRARRQRMTAGEISAFDEMFNMIFNAVSEQRSSSPGAPSTSTSTSARGEDLLLETGIGRRGAQAGHVGELLGRMRKSGRKVRWTTEADEELDRKKEEMDLCATDQALLEWAAREVFGESQRYEEAARRALSEDSSSGKDVDALSLQPRTYPHLIAALIRTFRDKHGDPNLALAVFAHARRLSVLSYVFGCTAPAYNELLHTRWAAFRDLRGVADALEEMTVNGVEPDARTRRIVEGIRRDIGARALQRHDGEGEEEWALLAKIEAMLAQHAAPRAKGVDFFDPRPAAARRKHHQDEAWKSTAVLDSADRSSTSDGWEFGSWSVRDRERPSNARNSQPQERLHFS